MAHQNHHFIQLFTAFDFHNGVINRHSLFPEGILNIQLPLNQPLGQPAPGIQL